MFLNICLLGGIVLLTSTIEKMILLETGSAMEGESLVFDKNAGGSGGTANVRKSGKCLIWAMLLAAFPKMLMLP